MDGKKINASTITNNQQEKIDFLYFRTATCSKNVRMISSLLTLVSFTQSICSSSCIKLHLDDALLKQLTPGAIYCLQVQGSVAQSLLGGGIWR